MEKLTWKCHVCGEERLDTYISVYKKRSEINGISFQQNIRYCNDKPECAEGAREVDFLNPKVIKKKEPEPYKERTTKRKKIRRRIT